MAPRSYPSLYSKPTGCIRIAYTCTFSQSLPLALRLFPGRAAGLNFFVEEPRISALDIASLLFPKRFLPPNPNLLSFFCRLKFGLPFAASRRASLSFLAVTSASSRATSKMSSSFSLVRVAPCRSKRPVSRVRARTNQFPHTSLQTADLLQSLTFRFRTFLFFGDLHLLAELLEVSLFPCLLSSLLSSRCVD